MIRVLHLASERTWRGGENQLKLLCGGLSLLGHTSYLAAPDKSMAWRNIDEVAEKLAVKMNLPVNFFSANRIAKFCRLRNVSVLHAHSAKSHTMALYVKMLVPHLRLVVHRRVDNVPRKNHFNQFKYNNSRIDHYIAVSHFIKRIMLGWGITRIPISVVHSAVPAADSDPQTRKTARERLLGELKIPADWTIIANVGALCDQKDQLSLVAAVKTIIEQDSKFVCLLAGIGELQEKLQQAIREGQLQDHVKLLGFRTNVTELLQATDILAHCPVNEGLGTVIQEAIHAGCTVVGTAVGGIPEMVVDQVTGLLSAATNPTDLAKNLLTAMHNPDLRAKLNAAARAHLSAEFSVDKMVEGNLEIYHRLVDGQVHLRR